MSRFQLGAALAIAAICGIGAAYLRPSRVVTIRQVVPDTIIIRRRPDTVLSLVQHIVYRRSPPDTVQVTATRTDTVHVAAYCAKDTTRGPVLPPASGRYDGHRLELFATRSDGKVVRQVNTVRPSFSWVPGPSAYVVTEHRHLPGWVVGALRSVACGGAAYGARQVGVPDNLAAGAAAGCVAGAWAF